MSKKRRYCRNQIRRNVVKITSLVVMKMSEDNAKQTLPPLHIILFFVINIWFSFVIAPFLAAGSQPDRNLDRIHIFIADNDGGDVGMALQNWATNILERTEFFYYFDFISTTDANLIKHKVRYGEAWAAIYANEDATQNLNDALADGCINYAIYDPSQAYTFVWDEGRSATQNKVYGAMTALLPRLSATYSKYLLDSIPSENISSCIQAGASSIIATPVSYTIDNLSPTSRAPVGNGLLTIGDILVAVYASLFIVNGIFKGCAPIIAQVQNPYHQVAFRGTLLVIYNLGLSCCLATIVIGLAADGSGHYLYSGNVWAQLMSIHWLHGMIWSFGHACVFVGLSPEVLPFNFAFFLVSSILGGWNTDLADVSYTSFYQIFPFTWVNNIVKNSLYGALPQAIGKSAGILLAECFFFVFLYFFLEFRNISIAASKNITPNSNTKAVVNQTDPANAYELVVTKSGDENSELASKAV